jgi:hypothetical protein
MRKISKGIGRKAKGREQRELKVEVGMRNAENK